MISTRPAHLQDAETIAALLVRSIREVCGPDYDNDERILASWCANKTPENVRQWIGNPDTSMVVAVEDEEIIGVGSISFKGEILLCYVLPEALHRGVGRAILGALMKQARAMGLNRITLESTITARAFYLRNGFIEIEPIRSMGLIPAFVMYRDLVNDNYA